MENYFLILISLWLLTSCSIQKKQIILNEDIVENKRIGNYSLSLTKKELDKFENATIDTLHTYITYSIPNIKIWFDTVKGKTDQICAFDNYSGKFRNTIEINDKVNKLSKISKYFYWKEEEIFMFKSINGISFEVPEAQFGLEKNQQTIDAICVYDESKLKMKIKNMINRKDFEFQE